MESGRPRQPALPSALPRPARQSRHGDRGGRHADGTAGPGGGAGPYEAATASGAASFWQVGAPGPGEPAAGSAPARSGADGTRRRRLGTRPPAAARRADGLSRDDGKHPGVDLPTHQSCAKFTTAIARDFIKDEEGVLQVL